LPTDEVAETENDPTTNADSERRGEKETPSSVLAGGLEDGKGVAGALRNALAILEGVLRDAPAAGAKSAA
jgi:hydroxymethylpyrimidine/phosphomethylpyrimidine kinase